MSDRTDLTSLPTRIAAMGFQYQMAALAGLQNLNQAMFHAGMAACNGMLATSARPATIRVPAPAGHDDGLVHGHGWAAQG